MMGGLLIFLLVERLNIVLVCHVFIRWEVWFIFNVGGVGRRGVDEVALFLVSLF